MQLLMPPGVGLLSLEDRQAELSIDLARTNVPSVMGALLAQLPVHDMTVDNPPLEQVIQTIYQQPKAVSMGSGGDGVQPAAGNAYA